MLFLGIIVGVMILTNPYLRSLGDHARWMDILAIITVPLLVILRVTVTKIQGLLGAGMIAILLIPWLLHDYWQTSGFDASLSVHWLLLSSFALALTMLSSEDRGREGLAFGMILGAAANCLLLKLQGLGFTQELITVGLSYPSLTFGTAWGAIRYFGLHGHPNGAAAVISLCIPAAISLNTEFRRSWFYVLVAVAICVEGAILTFSRSPFLVAGFLLLLWMLRMKSKYKYVVVATFLLVSGALIGSLSVSQLNNRWSTGTISDGNAAERFRTTMQSAKAILDFPLGLGSGFHELLDPPMYATHNGITALALWGGVPIALAVVISLFMTAITLWKTGRLSAWISLHVLGLCCFEEHFNNPTFIVLALWILLIDINRFWNATVKTRSRWSPAYLVNDRRPLPAARISTAG